MPTANETYEQAKARGNTTFADEWARVQQQLAKMTSGQRASQFGYTSLAEGEYVQVLDALGQAKMRIGHQSDGTVAVIYGNGKPPPVPTAPVVSARQLGVYVGWDGTFAGGYARPGDVVRVDVHMSEDDGFTVDGTTIVGSIPAEGGLLVGADSVTHYIRLVAVTNADVASAPTDAVGVLPLPAGQIAVGAIGADQLAANLALLSRLIVGNPTGPRLEIEGRDGAVPGLMLFDQSGSATVRLSALTGDVSIRGALRTNDTGERIVVAETPTANDIRFYPATGTAYSRLVARSYNDGGSVYAGIAMDGSLYNGRRAAMELYPNILGLGLRNESDGVYSDALLITDSYVQISSNSTGFRFTGISGSGGSIAQPGATTALLMQSNGLHVVFNNVTNIYKAVYASAFTVASARVTKQNIEPLPFDAVDVVRTAPASMYEVINDGERQFGQRRRKRFGPMADDLPDSVVVNGGPDGTVRSVDLVSQIGVLWAAVGQIAERLDRLPKGDQ